MPRAIPVPVRQVIIKRHQKGQDLGRIALELGLSHHTVRGIWRRFRDRGEAGLRTDYDHCGHVISPHHLRMYRRACWLKRRHPNWGGDRIREILQQRWPEESIPSARSLQRSFHRAGLAPRPS